MLIQSVTEAQYIYQNMLHRKLLPREIAMAYTGDLIRLEIGQTYEVNCKN